MAIKPKRKAAAGKKKPGAKPAPELVLARYRARIDQLDDAIIKLLLERTGVVREVAKLKAANWPSACHIRSGREGTMHQRIAKKFTGTDFSPKAALFLWRQIIGSSTALESPLHIAFLSSYPIYYWLAREYFGPLVDLTAVAGTALVEESNVLLLPAPETPGTEWWRHPPQHQGKPLRLFARLPLLEEALPKDVPAAVALAVITPEPSGDDISYLVLKTRTKQDIALLVRPARVFDHGTDYLLVYDGFVTPEDAALHRLRNTLNDELVSLTWLGTHPRPPQLDGEDHE